MNQEEMGPHRGHRKCKGRGTHTCLDLRERPAARQWLVSVGAWSEEYGFDPDGWEAIRGGFL